LVFDGVFARFPRLRGGVIELGAGWVPEYLRALDLSQKISNAPTHRSKRCR